METYSTRGMTPRSKVAYWNDVVCDVFTRMETEPYDLDRFEGEIRHTTLGRLSFSKVVSTPARVGHLRRHINRSRDHAFFLHIQTSGELKVEQGGREATLRRGDFALCDSAHPYTLSYPRDCELLVFHIPATMMRARVPYPEQLAGVAVSGNAGLGNTVAAMAQSLWDQMDFGIPGAMAQRVGENFLDVLGTAYGLAVGSGVSQSAVTGARRVQIKRYIEANLDDPEMTPRSIAAAFRISPRYLHMLFAEDDESVSHYVLRRRLEQCAKQMTDILWRKQTITEIAFRWGFNNATHFARVFKEHFAMSPRAYRNLHIPDSE